MDDENIVRTPVRVGEGNSSHRTAFEEFEAIADGGVVSLNVHEVSTKHDVHNDCSSLSVDMSPSTALEIAELLMRVAREAMGQPITTDEQAPVLSMTGRELMQALSAMSDSTLDRELVAFYADGNDGLCAGVEFVEEAVGEDEIMRPTILLAGEPEPG